MFSVFILNSNLIITNASPILRIHVRKMKHIPLVCKIRLQTLKDRKKEKLKILKRYIRRKYLRLQTTNDSTSDLWARSVDDFCHTSNNKSERKQSGSDLLTEVLERKRQYVIDCIAKRQLVNSKIKLLARIRKRFLNNKNIFLPKPVVSWVKDLPGKLNVNDNLFFGWNTQAENKIHLQDIFSRSFRNLVQEFDVLFENTYIFKVAKVLNKLAFTINAIDNGEFNSLNFLFKIYGTQKYDFEDAIVEVTSEDNIPSPDLAVLHDHVFPVFQRVNYFDYNNQTGEMLDSLDNALFVYRTELFPFLVCEYVLLRFLLKQTNNDISKIVKSQLRSEYDVITDTVIPNVCQMFPGVFTVLFLVYFDAYDHIDTKGILRLLLDIQSSITIGDFNRVTNNLRVISYFLCEVVYNIENDIWRIPAQYKQNLLSNMSFLKYNYMIGKSKDTFVRVNDMPFITR